MSPFAPNATVLDPHFVARELGGDVCGRNVLSPGPGHSRGDRSLSVKIDPAAPEGFVVYSFAGDAPIACREHVRSALGLGAWEQPPPSPRCSRSKAELESYLDGRKITMRSIKAYIARRLAANRATTEAPLPRRKRARAPDAGHKATVMPAVDTGVALPTVTAGSVPVRWRKLLLRRRQEITLISQSFEKLWNEHSPRHDFVTLQLKHPAQNKAELYWQNESRKKAARAYHTERKLNGSQPDSKTTELRRLLSNDISLDAAYRQLNASENRPTPQVSIEAIMVGVRERGLKALEERANIERLSRCDESARAQINSRIARISEQKQCQR